MSSAFWAGLGAIVLTNLLLSGDNAVVIAMAARGLPAAQRKKAIALGSLAAIALRVVLTLVAVRLLGLPGLELAGGALLLWIGAKLLSGGDAPPDVAARPTAVAAAVRTILVADLVMSLDNVLAVAAAARGDMPLLVTGLALSIPLIVFGSTLLLEVMTRFPVIVAAGAALLGWLGGQMMRSDPVLGQASDAAVRLAGGAGAVVVLAAGRWWRSARDRA